MNQHNLSRQYLIEFPVLMIYTQKHQEELLAMHQNSNKTTECIKLRRKPKMEESAIVKTKETFS